MLPLAGVVLAAGESRRMGTPKALLRFPAEQEGDKASGAPGKAFAEHLYGILNHPRIAWRRVILGADADLIASRLAIPPEAVLVNEGWQAGQLSSVQTALRALPVGQSGGVIVCPVDHPLVSAELVSRLIEQFDSSGKLVAIPTHRSRRGHPVIFHAVLYDELLSADPKIGAREVVWSHPQDTIEIPTEDPGVCLNLNVPNDLLVSSRFCPATGS